MVKIAFNIPRRNWYRVLAAPINESLRRGWDVTCLHGNEEGLQEDFPLPPFTITHDNFPVVRKYRGVDELTSVLKSCAFDVVVEADLIPKPLTEILYGHQAPPLKVLLEGITHPRLQFGGKLPRFDLYITPSQWYIESTINIMSRDHSAVFSKIDKKTKRRCKRFIADWKAMYVNRWSEEDIHYYRSNSVICGTPSLDDYRLIDRQQIRSRWGIPPGSKVVGLLPSPWDMPMGYLWGDLNMAGNSLDVLRIGLAYGLVKELPSMFRAPKDKDFVDAIHQFSKNNGALLVVKLRKNRKARKYLTERADLIVGEDSFFPHTALELFSISDVVFGFCSTGAFECVEANTPYVDLNIPYFPKNEVVKLSSPSTEVALPWKGAIYEIDSDQVIDRLPAMGLDDFLVNHKARIEYLSHFNSGISGNSSSKMLDAIEMKLKMGQAVRN